jgi:tungstate transport system ATP-binding protein
MLFEVKGLTKVYGKRTVLDLADLVLEEGIVYALQGPNGSGKTTLLEILSLLIPSTTGKVFYNGSKIDFAAKNAPKVRRDIVMVQQNPVLFSTTVYKNLDFGLGVRGIQRRERMRRIEESLDLVGMRPFMKAEAHRLSGGETHRVAIAQALVCSPRVMFFDEPTSDVDLENQGVIEKIIEDINAQKKMSIVFTTHNPDQAYRLSQGVISLFEGRKVSSAFENIFKGVVLVGQDGEIRCLIQGRVALPVKTEKRGGIRIYIDPRKARIAKAAEGLHERKTPKGKIVQLTDQDSHVRVAVDLGFTLHILMPKEQFISASLGLGEEVAISFAGDAIQVF